VLSLPNAPSASPGPEASPGAPHSAWGGSLSGLKLADADRAPGGFAHDARIGTMSCVIARPIAARIFDLWVDTLMAVMGPDILRQKAIVHVEGLEAPFALHGVRHVLEPPVPLPRWPSDDRATRIVIIGRGLPRAMIEDGFAFLRMAAEEARDLLDLLAAAGSRYGVQRSAIV
jgi:G3E family GTPase